MRTLLLLLLFTSCATADDWAHHLSPRTREKFAPMLREDWDPKRDVQLTDKEKAELRELFQPLVEQVRRRPVLLTPEPHQEAAPRKHSGHSLE